MGALVNLILPIEATMKVQTSLSPRQTANRLGITLNAVYALLWAGKISAERRNDRWYISAAAVEKRLAAKKHGQPSASNSKKRLG